MTQFDEAATTEGVVRVTSSHAPTDGSQLPSEDQQAFNEALRAGIRTLGELVRKRRKKR